MVLDPRAVERVQFAVMLLAAASNGTMKGDPEQARLLSELSGRSDAAEIAVATAQLAITLLTRMTEFGDVGSGTHLQQLAAALALLDGT